MRYHDDDEHDKELREGVNKMTLHEKDIERHSLDHRRHKDLKHLQIDEGY